MVLRSREDVVFLPLTALVQYLAIILVIIAGCKPANHTPENIEKAIIGEWETVSFAVDVTTANNRDSSYSIKVAEGQWPEKMRLLPARTIFSEHNYTLIMRNMGDTIVQQHRGIWRLKDDSLMMIEPATKYIYHLSWKKNSLYLSARIDWDRDGVQDDAYEAILKKL